MMSAERRKDCRQTMIASDSDNNDEGTLGSGKVVEAVVLIRLSLVSSSVAVLRLVAMNADVVEVAAVIFAAAASASEGEGEGEAIIAV